MNKAKTNSLDALRALIAERQQYEQWMSALETKREATSQQVFERVRGDYQGRLDRVVTDIRGHAEELQLSISTLSSRLVEVAREEDIRREGLQEAELRAAVGEYEPQHWEHLRAEGEEALGKIAGDRESLDAQLSELRAIQKLSEVGSVGTVPPASIVPAETASTPPESKRVQTPSEPSQSVAADAIPAESGGMSTGQVTEPSSSPANGLPASGPTLMVADKAVAAPSPALLGDGPIRAGAQKQAENRFPGQDRLLPESVAAPASSVSSNNDRVRPHHTPPGGGAAIRSRSEGPKTDQLKTLKCPECGTPNYPSEWYCERCGGELATM